MGESKKKLMVQFKPRGDILFVVESMGKTKKKLIVQFKPRGDI